MSLSSSPASSSPRLGARGGFSPCSLCASFWRPPATRRRCPAECRSPRRFPPVPRPPAPVHVWSSQAASLPAPPTSVHSRFPPVRRADVKRYSPMRFEPAESSETPSWGLPRAVVVLIGLAAAVIAVAGIKAFSSVIGPAFLALMLTVAIHPLHKWLHRKGVPLAVCGGNPQRGLRDLARPGGGAGAVHRQVRDHPARVPGEVRRPRPAGSSTSRGARRRLWRGREGTQYRRQPGLRHRHRNPRQHPGRVLRCAVHCRAAVVHGDGRDHLRAPVGDPAKNAARYRVGPDHVSAWASKSTYWCQRCSD